MLKNLLIFISLTSSSLYARTTPLQENTINTVKKRLLPLIEQYCPQNCQLIDIQVFLEKKVRASQNLGFENLTKEQPAKLYVKDVQINIQIDERVEYENREKLQLLFERYLKNLEFDFNINWVPTAIPDKSYSLSTVFHLKDRLKRKLEKTIQTTFDRYCPDSCLLSDISIDGSLVSANESKDIDPKELIVHRDPRTKLRINNVEILITLAEQLAESERQRITQMLTAKTKFVAPIDLQIEISPFPELGETRSRRLKNLEADPYGLEKLKQTLTLFKELASTKEIITSSEEGLDSDSMTQVATYTVIFLIVAGLLLLVLSRYSQAKQDANLMLSTLGKTKENEPRETTEPNQQESLDLSNRRNQLKKEMSQAFAQQPKVAKETFSRLIQEEGITTTAKYFHIFGKVIIFELLPDATMEKHLYELSEFYHKSDFKFTLQEEVELLTNLKTKFLANEIRILASHTLNQFDFLLQMDTPQLRNLIVEESPRVQSIVLTQLTPKRRRFLFNTFDGPARIALMGELCRAESLPKEYLNNVALALHQRVNASPEFDTQSLRGEDIIIELLEKSDLEEQKKIMRNLAENYPSALRNIKTKLITIHMLPYLKDGLLLEIILGMERQELLAFLSGCPDQIRLLLLSRVPPELAGSWREDLENFSTDENQYHLAELQILQRVKGLANTGSISVRTINDLIFQDLGGQDQDEDEEEKTLDFSHIVA